MNTQKNFYIWLFLDQTKRDFEGGFTFIIWNIHQLGFEFLIPFRILATWGKLGRFPMKEAGS